MATRKKAQTDIAALAAPVQPSAQPAFSAIVSGAALAIKAQARFDQTRPTQGLGRPTAAEAAAWSALCSPSAIMGMATIGKYAIHGHGSSDEGLKTLDHWVRAALGPELADKLPELAAGLSDLSADIDKASSSEAFRSSGAEHGRLIAAPAVGGGLAYPAFGVALSDKSNVMVDGKRSRSVVAVKLGEHGSFAWVSPEDRAQAARSWDQRGSLQKIEQLEKAADALPDPDAARAELAAGGAASASIDKFLGDRNAQDRAVTRFSAVLDEREGAAYLNGESPLPSVAAFERSALAEQAALRGRDHDYRNIQLGFSSAPKAQFIDTIAPQAASAFQRGAWKWALSSALAPEAPGKIAGLDRAQRLGFIPDPIAQARFGPWDKAGREPLLEAESLSEAGKILVAKGWARAENRYHYLHRDTAPAWNDLALHLHAGLSKRAQDELAERMEFSAAFSKARFGQLGNGLEGLAKFLSGEDSRVGLAQFAETLLSWKASFSRYSEDLDKNGQTTGSPELDRALSAYSASLTRAQSAFTAAAVDAARKTEAEWFASKNLLPAWRQALASGKPTSKSVAWAAANPVEEILESDDPIERLAARSARGLGLAAKAGAAALRESLYVEYSEMGAGRAAVDRLAQQPKLAERLARLAGALTEADRKASHASEQALRFSALAIESGLDMPAARAEGFAMAYAGSSLATFANGASHAEAPFDGMGPALSPVGVASRKSAQLLAELADAKREGYPQFVKALADDWNQTCQSALARGLSEEPAQALAADRAREISALFEHGSKIDWRTRPFADGRAAWEVFGMPSPRLTAALADARANGGPLGAWCAARSRAMGVADAVDGNDLIAKTRDAAKSLCGLTDGAWKLAIKDEESLKALSSAMGVDPQTSRYGEKKGAAQIAASFHLGDGPAMALSNRFGSERPPAQYNPMTSAGMALTAAASGGVSPKTAAAALSILAGTGQRDRMGSYYSLFGDGTLPAIVEGADGARFFIAEDDAKKNRAPKIFVEICKRLDKLTAAAAKPPKEGMAPIVPAKRLAEELSDLSDWIKGSEHGIWQTLPDEPTLGQLSRLSKAWHDETTAAARDKQERKTIAEQRKEEREAAREEDARLARAAEDAARLHEQRALANRGVPADPQAPQAPAAQARAAARPAAAANPFAAGSGAKWSKIIGKHAREGWEAVELLSASELSEEGSAMNHCVSSYSMQCREGSCRIFSIRLNGERKCTLEIRGPGKLADLNEFAEFSIHQNKGKSNATVNNAATLEFCAQTLGAVQDAWAGISRKFADERAKEEETKKKAAQEAKERAEREAFERKLAAEDKAREEAAKIERDIDDRIAARPNPEAGLAKTAEKLGARKAKNPPSDAALGTPAQGV